MDKVNRASARNTVPLEMINFELDTKSSVLGSGRASNTLFNSAEKVVPVLNTPQKGTNHAINQIRYSTQNIR